MFQFVTTTAMLILDVIFAFSRSKVAKAELTCSTKCELLFYKRFILHCNFKVLFFNLTVSVNYCFRRVNVGCGPAEERVLLTGLHAVADIYCECCKTTLGWKYVSIIFRFFFVWLPNNTRVISWENFPRVFRTVEGKHTIMQIFSPWWQQQSPSALKISGLMFLYFHFFSRSTPLRIARNTKRESSSSKWRIWSRIMDGNSEKEDRIFFYLQWTYIGFCTEINVLFINVKRAFIFEETTRYPDLSMTRII